MANYVRLWLVVSLAAWLLPSVACAQGTLKEGSKAPSLRHARWIKGQPATRFERGTVYVVEFWATWCGPCIQAIPRLSALAQRFEGKVVVIGVSIWESFPNPTGEDALPRVQQLMRIHELRKQKQYREALRELDRAEKRYPADADQIAMMRYETLLYADEAQAYRLAKRLSEGMFKDNANALNLMASLILKDDPERPLQSPDYTLALELAQRAAKLTEEKNPFILDTLAHALSKQGRYGEAVRVQERAVALLQQQGMPQEIVQDYQARLERLRRMLP